MTAAAAMTNGSGIFLNFHKTIIVANAIVTDGQSVSDRLPSTNTAPAMAPMAAAVMPSTKALMAGCFPYFLK